MGLPMLSRRNVLAAAAGAAFPALLLRSGAAAAADFPDRPVRIFNPTSPGGTLDQVGRILAEKMGPRLGQPVVLEHRPGGSGAIAANVVTHAPRDGYSMFFGTSSTLGFQKMLNKDLSYDPVRDFTPVALVGSVPVGIFSAPGSGINTIQDLIAMARAKPGQVSYGSTGLLSLTHLAGELLQHRAGIRMIHVPYTGSQQRYFTDLVGGNIQAAFTGVGGGLALVRDGRLKLLAIASRERSRLLPDVPALGELYPGLDVPAWFGFAVAAGTPAPLVQKLEEATLGALHDPATRPAFAQISVDLDPVMGSRDAIAKIRSENEMWEAVFQAAGLHA